MSLFNLLPVQKAEVIGASISTPVYFPNEFDYPNRLTCRSVGKARNVIVVLNVRGDVSALITTSTCTVR